MVGERAVWGGRILATVVGVTLTLSGCANSIRNEKDTLERLSSHIRAAEASCLGKKFPLLSQRISCNYTESYPHIKEYSEYLIPYYTTWRDQHLLAAQKYESYVLRPDMRAYNEAFELARAKFNSALRAAEPQYMVVNSKLDIEIKKGVAAAHCDSRRKFEALTCVKSALTPIWAQLSPNTSVVLSDQYEKLLVAAKKYDDDAGPLIDGALQTYTNAHAASNKELQAGIQSVVSSRMSFASAQDAQAQQNTQDFAKGVVDVLGTVLYLGASFVEGYAAGAGRELMPIRPLKQ